MMANKSMAPRHAPFVAYFLLLLGSMLIPLTSNAMAMSTSSSSPSSSMSTPPVSPPPALSTCAVVGVGVLGTSLCQQLVHQGDIQVTGITKTRNRHDEIRATVLVKDGASSDDYNPRFHLFSSDDDLPTTTTFDHVVFCAPPSGFDDYASAVQEAVDQLWNRQGVFVFTSSGAVYGGGDGEVTVVTESTPTADPSSNPRVGRLIRAEQAVLNAGGCCLRLAGLYNLERGAHNFWLTKGTVAASAFGIINLLHYEDAASACVAAIRAKLRSQVLLVSDGHPLTRREICAAALQARIYQNVAMPEFSDPSSTAHKTGKIYDAQVTNELLQWRPRYKSFDSFMKSQS